MNIYTGFIVGLLVVGVMVTIFIVIVNLYENHSGKKQEQGMGDAAELRQREGLSCQQQMLHTKELVMRTLRAIGCDPSVNEVDENRIDFVYQGGSFFMIASDSSMFAYLFFVWWYDSPLDNIDALSAIQKAVNNANCSNISCNVMYTIDQENNLVGVHSRSQLLFSPDIRDLENYLVAKLQEMFSVRHDVVHDIQNAQS